MITLSALYVGAIPLASAAAVAIGSNHIALTFQDATTGAAWDVALYVLGGGGSYTRIPGPNVDEAWPLRVDSSTGVSSSPSSRKRAV